MRIGITGSTGKLGSHLVSMGCIGLALDVTESKFDTGLDPGKDVIINCAAKTNVDKCETDKNYYWEAVEINGNGAINLSENFRGKIIHISTDYVFGGKRGPYSEDYLFDNHEDDLPARDMAYAITKFLGELNVKSRQNVHIVRTTGLYGGASPKHDFLNMILDSYYISDFPEIPVTKELRGNQTYIPHLAEGLLELADRLSNPHSTYPKILHIASREVISRYEFALMIADVYGLDKERLKPVKNSQVPGWVAARPKKGGLKVRLAEKLGIPIYSILEGLEEAHKNELQRK